MYFFTETKTKKRKSSEEMKVFYLEECLNMRRAEHQKRMSILDEIERQVKGRKPQSCTCDNASGYLEERSFAAL